MATIEIFQSENTTEDELKIRERIEIPEIQASRINPVNIKVSIPIPMPELLDFINEIEPIEEPNRKN